MSESKHTPGPWIADRDHQTHLTGHITICVGSPSTGLNWDIVAVVEKCEEVDANAKLIAAAPDHALYAAAITTGIARWEPWEQAGKGEVCVGGMRYATSLDDFGVPELSENIRLAIRNATT